MPATASQVDISAFNSWFENKKYDIYDRLEQELADPIFSLFTENKDPDKSLTIDTTGRDNVRTARTRTPGGNVETKAPIEELRGSQGYMSFEDSQMWEWEALVHDKYQFSDDQPEEIVSNVMRGISRLLHHQLFNSSTATSVTMPGSAGAYDLTLPNGQPVFSTAQTGPGHTPRSNLITADTPLSVVNIATARQHAISNFVLAGGERLTDFRGDTLIIPYNAQMIEAAKQITGSTLVPSSARNAINIYTGGSMDVIVLKYAPEAANYSYNTGSQFNWILADMNLLKKAFKYKFIAPPQILRQNFDVKNGNSQVTCLARVATYCERWQFGVRVNAVTAPTHPGL